MNNIMAKIIRKAMTARILSAPSAITTFRPLPISKRMRDRTANMRMKPWMITSSLDMAIHSCFNTLIQWICQEIFAVFEKLYDFFILFSGNGGESPPGFCRMPPTFSGNMFLRVKMYEKEEQEMPFDKKYFLCYDGNVSQRQYKEVSCIAFFCFKEAVLL